MKGKFMPKGLIKHIWEVAWALDCLLNAVLGGYGSETLSCRAYRRKEEEKIFAKTYKIIDFIIFWEPNHCEKSFNGMLDQRHIPPELRRKNASRLSSSQTE